MNSNDTRPQNRRNGRGARGGRRPSNDRRRDTRSQNDRPRDERPAPAKKLGLWQKIVAFFSRGAKRPAAQTSPARSDRPRPTEAPRTQRAKPEPVEVTSPKLYVGNLNYDATENDLSELFNGVGKVQNAEIVTHKGSYKSKGFGFVTMLTVDEARRAVEKLHDQAFMGRKLVVNGSKSDGPRDSDHD